MRKNHDPLGTAVGVCVAVVAVASATIGMFRPINHVALAASAGEIAATGHTSTEAVGAASTALTETWASPSGTAPATPPTISPPNSFAPVPGAASAQDFAQAVLAQVNQVRAQARTCGNLSFGPAAPVSLQDRLMDAAQHHAADQAMHRFMSHAGSTGSSPADRVTAAGYAWQSTGENVAMGQTTAAEVVDAWVKSPGHCKNIMEPAYVHMGIGRAEDSQGVPYWAQTFGAPR